MADTPPVTPNDTFASFQITDLKITTCNKQNIDLKANYVEINLYESVFSPVVVGDILIVDQFDFPSFGPLLGGEDITIQITNILSDDKSNNKENIFHFVVYSVEKRIVSLQRSQTYLLKFCSKEAIWNQEVRICTTFFQQKYSLMTDNIFDAWNEEIKKMYGGDPYPDAPKFLFTADSKDEEKVTIHFPNLHPLECFFYLAGKAEKKKEGNPYFFFETLDNYFNFISWYDLIEKFNHNKEGNVPKDLQIDTSSYKKNKPILINSVASLLKDTGPKADTSFYHYPNDFFTPMTFSFDKDFDFIENTRKGVYASELIVYDNTTKRIKQFKYSYDELYNKVPRIVDDQANALNTFKAKSDYKCPKYTQTYIKAIPSSSELFLKDKVDLSPEITKNYRILKLQELNNDFLTVNLPGDTNVHAGFFADVFFSAPATYELKPSADPHFAGVYFMLRVRHCFKSDNSFVTSVELSKDSFMDITIQKLPPPPKE